MIEKQEALEQLIELRNEMLDKLSEMERIIEYLDSDDSGIYARATSSWLASVSVNLGDDRWIGDLMVTFDDTHNEFQVMIDKANESLGL